MKTQFSILSAKLTQKASKMLGKGGSATPGHIARKIDPNILKKMRANVDKVIFISGTNGKTTTSQVLAAILSEAEGPIVHNIEGSNMATGITSAFVTSQNMLGNKKIKYGVIEIDEGSIDRVFKEITPDYFLFTNFFRDQLDRYGEIDMLVDSIKENLENKDIKLVLNADDPFIRRLSNGKKTSYFGLGAKAYEFGKQSTMESTYCPNCRNKLVYSTVHYGQLGHYSCTNCSFGRPNEKYQVQKMEINNGIQLEMNRIKLKTNLFGDYNVINIAGAVAVAKELGIEWDIVKKALEKLQIQNGRMEFIHVNEKKILLNLAKNPAGLNVSFENIRNLKGEKNVLILLNDKGFDGRDISWIWDADFESLAEMEVKEFHCSGIRAEELALRLKYAGIEESRIKVEKEERKAIERSLENSENLFVIPNYTQLINTRNEILKLKESQERKAEKNGSVSA